MKRGYEERLRDKHAEKMRQAAERAKAEKAQKLGHKPVSTDQNAPQREA